jgi:hypothetical protein
MRRFSLEFFIHPIPFGFERKRSIVEDEPTIYPAGEILSKIKCQLKSKMSGSRFRVQRL